jgi:predicted small secreted protein
MHMRKFFLIITIIMTAGFFLSGCATWQGIKKDTGKLIDVVES